MATARTASPYEIQEFALFPTAREIGSKRLLHFTNLLYQTDHLSDHAAVETMAIREFEHGAHNVIACDCNSEMLVAVVTWRPVDEARFGKAKLMRIGWIEGEDHPGLLDALLLAAEGQAMGWFSKKHAQLRQLTMRIPVTSTTMHSVLERCGFQQLGLLPRYIQGRIDARYMVKEFHPEVQP